MNLPHMLIMRATPDGCIWQAYRVETEQERHLIARTARKNGFFVEQQAADYAEETSPGWRDTPEWKAYAAKYSSEEL